MIPAIYFNGQKNTAQDCISRGLCIDFNSENIIHIVFFNLITSHFINTLIWRSDKNPPPVGAESSPDVHVFLSFSF